MNNQSVTLLETHHVVMNTLQPDFRLANDWADGEAEMRRILDTHHGPLFIINDIREMKMSIDDLILAASLGTRGKDPIWRHPNARGAYFISERKFVEMAAAGLNSPAFGNMRVKVFHTLEEALADIDSVMAR